MVGGRAGKLLFKKMLRDIGRSLSAYFMSMVVAALGIMAFCAISISHSNFTVAMQEFYNTTSFADGFVNVSAAPISAQQSIT